MQLKTVENDKKKVDNAKAVEMRGRALETLGKTQKRQRNEEENANQSKKVVEVEVAQLHISAKKMCLFRSGKRKNYSCKSRELKLRVNGKISKKTSRYDENLARTNQVATRADAKLSADVYLNATAAVSNNYEASREKK